MKIDLPKTGPLAFATRVVEWRNTCAELDELRTAVNDLRRRMELREARDTCNAHQPHFWPPVTMANVPAIAFCNWGRQSIEHIGHPTYSRSLVDMLSARFDARLGMLAAA